MPPFGVLALQGDFAAHAGALLALGVDLREIRRVDELAGLAGLVLPGGESSTLLNLMRDEPWFEGLHRLHARGGAFLGTCAGAILLSKEVAPTQPSLGLLDAVVERNAYGRQIDSFEARLDAPGLARPIKGIFIRAPRFTSVGPGVEVLARLDGEPVLVRQDRVLAASFHPELRGGAEVHRLFVELASTETAQAESSNR